MKEGAGEDPFASEGESPVEESSTTETTTSESESKASESTESSRQQRAMQIPYKFRRDGVQDGRERVPLFLQSETKSGERDAQRELEDRFDDDVSLTDLREALMKTGLDHLDEVEEHLEEWGYGMTFDE
ncbi:Vng6335h (plasmid) [Halobacterium salinarum NRC-1]|nr:Vng6335h [Halobacterium salinarum NRC-1]